MKTVFYKIECLTNMHAGSGDINYNVVDNEVEKDPVTGLPMIHASGVKGALRDYFKAKGSIDVNVVFGAPGSGDSGTYGTHRFFDAMLLSRKMRVSNGNIASISVVTVDSVNQFINMKNAFNLDGKKIETVPEIDFGDNEFLIYGTTAKVEGASTGKLDDKIAELIKNVVGEGPFAVAKSFENYDLPVLARNYLVNGESKNLWYEEVVPHGSVLWFAIGYPDDNYFDFTNEIVQFGGNATVGCGYTTITAI